MLYASSRFPPPPPALSAEQAQPPASVYFRISLSAQPFSKVRPPAPTSRPEFDAVDPVVPDVVKLTPREPAEIERPFPVKSVNASPARVIPPELITPAIVKSPAERTGI